jgi:16S rRNA (cytosine1402-N4)-methyltransferase
MSDAASHIPVMLDDMLAALHPKDGEVYVDGTFGAGGYTRAILERANCTVIAIDQDPEAGPRASAMQAKYGARLKFIAGNFGDLEALLLRENIALVDGVVLDIGVSSMQLDTPERGFSFRFDAPLDMRMSKQGMSAADFLNSADESEIAHVLREYGEEPAARKIARVIVAKRAEAPIETTKQLADIVHSVVGRKHKTDPATKTFQALRIHINNELGALKAVLEAAERVLKADGRLVVVSFHSLEDRMVKQFFKERSAGNDNVSRHLPEQKNGALPSFVLVRPVKVRASDAEISRNPKSRSATLRRGLRTAHAAWRVV